MRFGDIIDRAIEPFAPRWTAQRIAARAGIAAYRQYDAAAFGRRANGIRRPQTDADAENARASARLRATGYEMFRNNKYVNSAVRHMVADMIGDGIAPQFAHEDKAVAKRAQDHWNRWAESKVDGEDDFYGYEKIAAQTTIVGGEVLTQWKDANGVPNSRISGLEGDFLDQAKQEDRVDGSRITQGVEFDRAGERSAYWLFDKHPGGSMLLSTFKSSPVDARYVDHLYDRQRFGQTRGVSWLAAVALDLNDIGDIEDAVRMQQKVQACLGLILVPGSGEGTSPLSTTQQAKVDPARTGRLEESVSPGMIYRAAQGDQVQTINPSQSGGAVEFIRQQLAAASATLAPYHRMTGDVTQANYSSLRAAMLGQWALLDDWQQNIIIPRLVKPAVLRRMQIAALETGDRRILDCGISYALPVRRFVDPIKDLMAELIEIRSGIKTLTRSLAERGINAEEHLQAIKQVNDQIDLLGLALDSDPRRVTGAGVLQAAAGYIAPRAEAA
ncbi:MAG: portal protein [Rhizobiaceae bacterium]|nr:portal protein [Rhizobiaceae bacterium]